jgi:hypothetical protein
MVIVGAAVVLLAGISLARALESEDVLRLLAGLPEAFIVEGTSEIAAPAPAGEPGRIFRIRSLRPLEETDSGALYAKLSLAAWEVGDADAAKAEVKRRLAAADPDTGLTYAWDFFTSRDDSVIHLHADCTVSEDLFLLVSTRLRKEKRVDGLHAEESFSCRCGGGCGPAAVEPPAAEVPLGLPRVRPLAEDWEDYDNRLDPSGAWESDIGELSLMHHASGLSFSYLAVFAPSAHICEGAGVAGLVGRDRYEYVDEQGTIAFVVSDRAVRLELTEGIAPFCGAGWPGDSFSIERHKPPSRCEVTAERAYFHVTDHLQPERRGAFIVRGDQVETVHVELSFAERMVLGRFVRPQTAAVGLLRLDDLACHHLE